MDYLVGGVVLSFLDIVKGPALANENVKIYLFTSGLYIFPGILNTVRQVVLN